MHLKNYIIIILIVLSIFYSCGCINDNNIHKEKILGSWITEKSVGQDDKAEFNFYSNNTYSFIVTITNNDSNKKNDTFTFWWPYNFNNKKLIMEIEGRNENLEYFFNEDYNVLTLIEDNGETTVLIRND